MAFVIAQGIGLYSVCGFELNELGRVRQGELRES